jgi:UDP-glucose 4-epimerase
MVLPRFVAAVREGRALEVYGDGTQTRCFLAVEDAVERVLRLWDEPRALGEVVNVGSARERSIEELARLVRARARVDVPIVHLPYREAYGMAMADFRRRVPHLGRLEGLIGRLPERPLEEVVDELLGAGSVCG